MSESFLEECLHRLEKVSDGARKSLLLVYYYNINIFIPWIGSCSVAYCHALDRNNFFFKKKLYCKTAGVVPFIATLHNNPSQE